MRGSSIEFGQRSRVTDDIGLPPAIAETIGDISAAVSVLSGRDHRGERAMRVRS